MENNLNEQTQGVTVEKKKVDVMRTFTDVFSLGAKNFLPVLLTWVLYLLTIWIPYINVGTTIAIQGLPLKIAAGESFSPTFIFAPEYRKKMGGFILLTGFLLLGIFMATLFLIIPGIVLSYTWCLAILVFLDKNLTPLDALKKSNEMTYGSKWRIFAAELLISIAIVVAEIVLSALAGLVGEVLVVIVVLIVAVFAGFASSFMNASIWKQLTE